MALEIERKFLLKNNGWKAVADDGTVLKQAYLNTDPERTVRIRIKKDKGYLTIKGKTVKSTRQEFEYEIPFDEANDLLQLCEAPIIEKTRYLVEVNELTWEIDIFEGVNAGLEVAEIELTNEDQQVILPNWIGKEVTDDARYYNSSLVSCPFSLWEK